MESESQEVSLTNSEARKSLALPRIAIADDDEDVRTLLTHGLRHHGYSAITFDNGGSLLEHVASEMIHPRGRRRVSAIILDVCMPDYSGLQILRELRAIDARTPFFIITAKEDKETHDLARRFGATAFFQKPFELNAFVRVLDQTLAVRSDP